MEKYRGAPADAGLKAALADNTYDEIRLEEGVYSVTSTISTLHIATSSTLVVTVNVPGTYATLDGLNERRVICLEQLADRRVDARLSTADRFDFRLRADHLVHVGGRAADIADDSFEIGVLRHRVDFAQDGLLAA